MGYELGVDLGTTYTAAATARGGLVEIASLGLRTLEVPSVAFLLDDGRMVVGDPAERRSVTQPDRFAREFKRRMGDPTPIILGGTPFSAPALTARLLRSVVTTVSQREGGPPDHTVVTCPASWSAYKRDLLDQAIRQADIGPATMTTEPEAAAVHYASTTRVGPGDVVAVYDLGGGTFDAAVLRARDDGGFELLGVPQGLDHLGGVLFDDAILDHVTGQLADRLAALDPDDPVVLTALAQLRRECVEAKEALSSDSEARVLVTLPGWQTEILITRRDLDAMVRPALLDTVETLRRTLRSADLGPDDVTAVLLVGGSSRMPLVAELVGRELGRPTAVDVHPKHAVAMGAARLAAAARGRPLPRAPLPPPPFIPVAGPREAEPIPPAPVPARDGNVEAPRTEQPLPLRSPPEGPVPVGPPEGQPPVGPSPEGPPPEGPVPGLPEPVGAGAGTSPFDQTRGDVRETSPVLVTSPEEPSRRSGRLLLVAGAVGAVVVLGGALLLVRDGGGSEGGAGGSADRIAAEATAATQPCTAPERAEGGAELVDYSVFAGGLPDDLDPARDVTPASAQLVDALYDGLTTVDAADAGDRPRVRLQVAEAYEANDDATEWTFTIREGLQFSNGEPVLPSSFVRAWERATDADMQAGDAYLFGVIDGGWEKLDGSADTISGLHADDDARTLRVVLDVPYAELDALVAFQPFMPMPEAAAELDDPAEWDEGEMVGNGPFAMASPADAGDGVSLVPNPRWNGTCYDAALDLPEQPAVASIALRPPPRGSTGHDAVVDGSGHVAAVSVAGRGETDEGLGNTFDAPLTTTSFLAVNWDDPIVGGRGSEVLRQAISQAVDRQALADEVYAGTATPAGAVTMPSVSGASSELCDHCVYDPDAAGAALQAWQDEGNQLDEPLRVQSAAAPGRSDPVAARVVADLEAAGIPAVEDPLGGEDYLALLRDGACQVCLVTRSISFLSYESLVYDLFHSDSIDRSNYGRYADEDFDTDVYEARSVLDRSERAEGYRSAERHLLNETVGAIPLLWSGPPYVHAGEVESLPVDGVGHVVWERVAVEG